VGIVVKMLVEVRLSCLATPFDLAADCWVGRALLYPSGDPLPLPPALFPFDFERSIIWTLVVFGRSY
jgi:hypothetical protein